MIGRRRVPSRITWHVPGTVYERARHSVRTPTTGQTTHGPVCTLPAAATTGFELCRRRASSVHKYSSCRSAVYIACVMLSADSTRRGSHAAAQDVFQPVLTQKRAWGYTSYQLPIWVDTSRLLASSLTHNVLTLSPCAVESHPTPGDSRGSSSPSRSLSGVSSHVADGGSARIPLESVHPYLPWSSSLSRSIHSPEHHVIFHPSCSHHVSKVA